MIKWGVASVGWVSSSYKKPTNLYSKETSNLPLFRLLTKIQRKPRLLNNM